MRVRFPSTGPMAKSKTSPDDIVQYYGKNIRRSYSRLLRMADEDHVRFHLDSAYRSIKEQWRLWRLYKAGKGPVAAFPGTSTHNRRSWKQGLDINALDGGTQRFIHWAKMHGMTFTLTVRGEAWHVNAAANYDHKIYTMWHAREEQKSHQKSIEHTLLEEDRKAKQRGITSETKDA